MNLQTISKMLIVLLLVISVFTGSHAQTKKKEKTIKYYTVAANQVMRVRLNNGLDSEKARIGDTFTSTLVDPVYSKTGLLLAPQESIVGGRVTSVQRARRRKGSRRSCLFSSRSLELPNGYRRALNGSLTDLESSTGTSDNEARLQRTRLVIGKRNSLAAVPRRAR